MEELNLVIIKPDGMKLSIGEIFLRLEKTHLKRSALKITTATIKQCIAHYNKDEKWLLEKGFRMIENMKKDGQAIEKEAIDYGLEIIQKTIDHLTSNIIIIMVYEGYDAINIIKKIVGTTEPISSPKGTIRGDLGTDSYHQAVIENRALKNLIHCSDSPKEALREIPIWFSQEELNNLCLTKYFI